MKIIKSGLPVPKSNEAVERVNTMIPVFAQYGNFRILLMGNYNENIYLVTNLGKKVSGLLIELEDGLLYKIENNLTDQEIEVSYPIIDYPDLEKFLGEMNNLCRI